VTLFCRSRLPKVFLRSIQTMIASDPAAPIAAPSTGSGVKGRVRLAVKTVVFAAVLGIASAAAQGKPETAGIETHGIAVRARQLSSFATANAVEQARMAWRARAVVRVREFRRLVGPRAWQ
jgi:hypothetical protein